MTTTTQPVHVFFVLDRSGSMETIQSDVIGGFNSFVTQQREQAGACRMTLIQFDSQDPHEVIADACPIDEIGLLNKTTFVPRGMTPLYDVMGHAIADATIRAEKRLDVGEPDEEILFVTFTDGMENASQEYDRPSVLGLIEKCEQKGWTFAYLGANQDAYEEGGKLGYKRASTQSFDADSASTSLAFSSISRAVSSRRDKVLSGETYDRSDFFEGDKAAEEDGKKGRGREHKPHQASGPSPHRR
jgi:hypothetical protein